MARALRTVMVIMVVLSLGFSPVCAAVSAHPWKTPCHKKTALDDGTDTSGRNPCTLSPCHTPARRLFPPPDTGPRRGEVQSRADGVFLDADLTRNAAGACRPLRAGLFVPDLFPDRSPPLFSLHRVFLC